MQAGLQAGARATAWRDNLPRPWGGLAELAWAPSLSMLQPQVLAPWRSPQQLAPQLPRCRIARSPQLARQGLTGHKTAPTSERSPLQSCACTATARSDAASVVATLPPSPPRAPPPPLPARLPARLPAAACAPQAAPAFAGLPGPAPARRHWVPGSRLRRQPSLLGRHPRLRLQALSSSLSPAGRPAALAGPRSAPPPPGSPCLALQPTGHRPSAPRGAQQRAAPCPVARGPGGRRL